MCPECDPLKQQLEQAQQRIAELRELLVEPEMAEDKLVPELRLRFEQAFLAYKQAHRRIAELEAHYKLEHICLICGRNEPCMTEADLQPGDPGIPCTFDPTPRELFDDNKRVRQLWKRAEAERDRLREQITNQSLKLISADYEYTTLREKLAAVVGLVEMARDELGVPGPGYPAPVTNAVAFIQAALAKAMEA